MPASAVEEPTWGQAAKEVVGYGAVGLVEGIAGIGSGAVYLGTLGNVDLPSKVDGLAPPQTNLGGFSRGVTRFLPGLVPGLGLTKAASGLKAVQALPAIARGKLVQSTVSGFIAEFLTNPDKENLSSRLIEMDNPVFNNAATQYLAGEADDNQFTSRLKNAMENGLILGVASEVGIKAIVSSFKLSKRLLSPRALDAEVAGISELTPKEAEEIAKLITEAESTKRAWAEEVKKEMGKEVPGFSPLTEQEAKVLAGNIEKANSTRVSELTDEEAAEFASRMQANGGSTGVSEFTDEEAANWANVIGKDGKSAADVVEALRPKTPSEAPVKVPPQSAPMRLPDGPPPKGVVVSPKISQRADYTPDSMIGDSPTPKKNYDKVVTDSMPDDSPYSDNYGAAKGRAVPLNPQAVKPLATLGQEAMAKYRAARAVFEMNPEANKDKVGAFIRQLVTEGSATKVDESLLYSIYSTSDLGLFDTVESIHLLDQANLRKRFNGTSGSTPLDDGVNLNGFAAGKRVTTATGEEIIKTSVFLDKRLSELGDSTAYFFIHEMGHIAWTTADDKLKKAGEVIFNDLKKRGLLDEVYTKFGMQKRMPYAHADAEEFMVDIAAVSLISRETPKGYLGEIAAAFGQRMTDFVDVMRAFFNGSEALVGKAEIERLNYFSDLLHGRTPAKPVKKAGTLGTPKASMSFNKTQAAEELLQRKGGLTDEEIAQVGQTSFWNYARTNATKETDEVIATLAKQVEEGWKTTKPDLSNFTAIKEANELVATGDVQAIMEASQPVADHLKSNIVAGRIVTLGYAGESSRIAKTLVGKDPSEWGSSMSELMENLLQTAKFYAVTGRLRRGAAAATQGGNIIVEGRIPGTQARGAASDALGGAERTGTAGEALGGSGGKGVQNVQSVATSEPYGGQHVFDLPDNPMPGSLPADWAAQLKDLPEVKPVIELIDRVVNMSQPGFTPEDVTKLISAIALGKPSQVTKVLDAASKGGASFLKKALEVWTNGLLSGMRTHVANTVSNIGGLVSAPLELAMGGQVNAGLRLYRSIAAEFMDSFKLYDLTEKMSSFQAAKKAFDTERGVLTPMTGREVGLEVGAIAGKKGRIVRLPWRIMGATDEYFKQLNYRSFMRAEATRAAEAANVPEAEFAKFVDNWMQTEAFKSPGVAKIFEKNGKMVQSDVVKSGMFYTLENTFQHELKAGTIGYGIQRMVNQVPALRFILPFVKTPTNIIDKTWRLTPLLNFANKEYRERLLRSTDPIIKARARGEMMLGISFTATALFAAYSGFVTGNGPKNRQERDVLLASGWQPNSFVFPQADGSKVYINYSKMDPFATFFSVVADVKDAHSIALQNDDNTTIDLLLNLVQATAVSQAKNMTSKTYYTGARQFMEMMSDPEARGPDQIGKFLASWIPAIAQNKNIPGEEYMKETRRIVDHVYAATPGLQSLLEPRRTVTGHAQPAPGFTKFQPYTYVKALSDPAKQEMAELHYGFGKPPPVRGGVDLTQIKSKNGQTAYDRWQELHSIATIGDKTLIERLNGLVASSKYQSLPKPTGKLDTENVRIKAIRGVISDYRERAWKQVLKEYPDLAPALRQTKLQANRRQETGGTLGVLSGLNK